MRISGLLPRSLVLGVALLCVNGGCRPKQANQPGATLSSGAQAPAQPSAGLDGTWKAVAVEIDGQQVPPEEVAKNPGLLEFSGSRVAVKAGARTFGEGTVRVDNSQQPKAIDLNGISLGGTQAGKSAGAIGVYEVSGDTLKICFTDPGGQRPKTLQTQPGSGATLITYGRVR
jgi:uncharacterized protein (TIGR03067 family)